MIIDLEKLPGTDSVVSGDHRVIYHDIHGEEIPVDGHIEAAIHKSGELYSIQADVRGFLNTFCHKCLEQTKYELKSSFEVVVQTSDERKEEESSLLSDEYITLPKGEHEVSLDGHIYESLIVSIPMQILCSADCKGLCSNCGANLNHESCSCDKTGDPRWDALKKLKDRFSS